jgi:nucleoside-diphosphate-sugar epimerase
MKIFVAGAIGALGRRLVPLLKAGGARGRRIDQVFSQDRPIAPLGCKAGRCGRA